MAALRVQGSFDRNVVQGVEEDTSFEYRIACAQVLPSDDGVKGQGGLGKLAIYAQEASKRGADVVVFPEYFLTGATHDAWRAVRQEGSSSASEATHPDEDSEHFLRLIGGIAQENDIDIVAGTVVELGGTHVPHRSEEVKPTTAAQSRSDDHDEKLFNTVYYIDRKGKIAGRYTKKNLWHPERAVLSPGHELRHKAPKTFTITTKRGKELRAGIAVCWDLAFPETFRDMFDSVPGTKTLIGPDIVFAPTCWYATDGGQTGMRWNPTCEAALLDSICVTRAIENECILAMTNIAGPPMPQDRPIDSLTEQDAIGVGRTSVCAPFAGCIQRLEDGGEALLLASVDLRMVEDARELYRCRYDLRDAWCAQETSK